MGINVGSGWCATTQNGTSYIQIVFDDVITNMIPGLKGVKLGLYYVKEKTSEKAPDFSLQAYIPKPKKDEEEKHPIIEMFDANEE